VDVFVGTALHFVQTAPKKAKAVPKGLSVSDLQFDPVFSVLHKLELPRFSGQVRACVLGNTQMARFILDWGLKVQGRVTAA
jgi:hypothetical protein